MALTPHVHLGFLDWNIYFIDGGNYQYDTNTDKIIFLTNPECELKMRCFYLPIFESVIMDEHPIF